MQIIYNIFNVILDAGAVVMLPIIITIVGLIFQVKLSKAFRSGLTIGIGFAGINLVINMLKSNLGPAAQAMVENFGIKLDILDVGWGAIAAVTWSSPIPVNKEIAPTTGIFTFPPVNFPVVTKRSKLSALAFTSKSLHCVTVTAMPFSSHFSRIFVATTVDVAIPFPHATNILFIS